jgi:hypothetical protein
MVDPASGRTPLHQAVMERDFEKTEFLCRFGGDLFALDNHLRNPSKVVRAYVTLREMCV